MSPDARTRARDHGNAASTVLEQLAPSDPKANEKLAEATRRLVLMRDALIDGQRSGDDCAQQLGGTNAAISAIFGLEFPVDGLQWARVRETRDGLRRLLDARW